MFTWWRNRRRRKLLDEPFPAWWEAILKRNVAHYELLMPAQQRDLQDITRILISEKRWEGCNGLTVTPEMQVTVAAQAALLLLGIKHDYFQRVSSIVLYPSHFSTPNPEDDWEDDELSDTMLSGQAVYRGPVILAWDEVIRESRHPEDGFNVVIHEFAHQLDFYDYEINGTPPLATQELADRWAKVMQAGYEQHVQTLRSGQETFFTQHAADDETEFFADASEAFYCRPHDLHAFDQDIFELLASYYQVDPRKWFVEDHSHFSRHH
jgi:MtfA peptidase